MSDHDRARDKAAKLLKKQGSMSSLASSDIRHDSRHYKQGPGSVSAVSFMDEPGHGDHFHPPVRQENTYQMEPSRKFPAGKIKRMVKDTLENYIGEDQYEPEHCRNLTKSVTELIKGRVKDLMIPRYRVIVLVHIGQLGNQGVRIGSRCLWDDKCDTFTSVEYRNKTMFATAMVFGVYYE